MRISTRPSSVIPYNQVRAYPRRPIGSVWAGLTCLVLFRHQENAEALLVSDDGDPVGAVWVPKAMLTIDGTDRGRFLVVTLPRNLAAQKRLSLRLLDWSRFAPGEAELLAEAVASATRTRNRLLGHRQPLPFPGRNAFA